jgi:uncharacterized membrane protein
MRERTWPLLLFVVFVAIAAYIGYQGTLYYVVTNSWVDHERSIAMRAGGIGVLGRSTPLRTAFANPDFDYSACVFDLRAEPYLLKGPDADEYWSLTMFNRRGEAVFSVAGPGTEKAGPYLVYAEASAMPAKSPDYKIIQVPDAQGIAVFRLLANRAGRKPLSDLQDELRCEPYRPAR